LRQANICRAPAPANDQLDAGQNGALKAFASAQPAGNWMPAGGGVMMALSACGGQQ
jgi:hypothetical protein